MFSSGLTEFPCLLSTWTSNSKIYNSEMSTPYPSLTKLLAEKWNLFSCNLGLAFVPSKTLPTKSLSYLILSWYFLYTWFSGFIFPNFCIPISKLISESWSNSSWKSSSFNLKQLKAPS